MRLNWRLIARILGLLSLGTGGFMVTAVPWAIYFREFDSIRHVAVSALVCGIAGGALLVAGRRADQTIQQRDALLLVALSWAWVAMLGSIPFVISGLLGPIDAYFEIMSGFTTTGSSVMTDLDTAPRSLVFWRNLTHWLGGLGVVLMLIAVLPYLGTGGKMLFRRESTGPDPRGIRPRVRETARMLYKIYIGLTIIGTVAYMAVGMNLYEALNHCFGALATGGFSTRYDNLAAFDSVPIEMVSTVLMLVGAVNFGLYFQMWQGDWKAPLRDTEFKVFIGIFVVAVTLVMLNLMGMSSNVPEVRMTEQVAPAVAEDLPTAAGMPSPRVHYSLPTALRKSSVQVASMMTDTGFVADNFDLWPYFSRVLLMIVAITGGCVGSTAGGLKIIRVVLLAKMIRRGLERAYRPHVVRAIRFNDQVIEPEVQRRILEFFCLYTAWMVFGILVMTMLGLPLDSAFGAIVATLNNMGPGLEYTFADFSIVTPLGKLFLTFNMLVGRLEIVTILTLFTPAFWRSE